MMTHGLGFKTHLLECLGVHWPGLGRIVSHKDDLLA